MNILPYLQFNGNCEEAFKFYEKCLGGKIEAMMPHKGSPAEAHVPPEWGSKILNARMSVGSAKFMASDAPPGHYTKPQGFSVTLDVTDPAEAERIFRELSENAEVVAMPMQETFWATR